MEFNFLKYDLRKIDHLGAKYDTCSVMHYGAYAFAKVSKNQGHLVSFSFNKISIIYFVSLKSAMRFGHRFYESGK